MNDERIAAYTACIDRVCDWIEQNRNDDGSWKQGGDASGYISVAPFANYIGRRDLSLAALRFVQDNFIGGDGTLIQEHRFQSRLGYVPGWFLWGAVDAGCYSLSNALAPALERLQSDRTGALLGNPTLGDAIEFDATTMGTFADLHGCSIP